MRAGSTLPLLIAAITGWPTVTHAAPFEVTGTLLTLPRSPHCTTRRITVSARYRADSVGQGAPRGLALGQELLVMHLCPAHHRGWSREAEGSAGPLHPGDHHRLLLEVAPRASARAAAVDPFPEPLPRYRALRTDPAPTLPRITVRVAGPAGAAWAIDFEQQEIAVGRDADSDVRLDDPSVAPRHLRLVVDPRLRRVVAHPLAGSAVALDGAPLAQRAALGRRSRLSVGLYALRVTLRWR